ncbi:MAG: macro domain-containing protein [Candidatus Bathyarchaeia archaeon]
MVWRFSETGILVKRGSITEEEVDAVTNPANSYLYMGGGAAGAIKRVGGEIIEREARRHAPVPIGEAIATTAGNLRARFVIHAPTMETPGPTTPANVYKATRAALECADRVGATSIAIPGMGTGIGGVPTDEAAEAMVRAIKEHAEAGTGIGRIVLVDLNPRMVEELEKALRKP